MSVVIGIGVSFFGTLCSASGYTFQKYCHNKLAKLPEALRKNYYEERKWQIGLFLMIVGAISSTVCYGLAPQSALSPMGAITMVDNAILAHIFLKEKIDLSAGISTAFMLAGVIISVSSGDMDSDSLNLVEMIDSFTSVRAIVYTVILLTILLMMGLYMVYIIYYVGFNHMKPIHYNISLFCFPIFAGFMGGYTGLCTKAVVGVIVADDLGSSIFRIEPYIFGLGAILCISTQLAVFNGGLKRYDSLQIVPIYQSCLVISGSLSGGFYYNEMKDFTLLQWVLFPFGCFLTVVGIIILITRKRTLAQTHTDNSNISTDGERFGRRKNLDIIRFYNQLEFDLIEWKKSYQYQQQHQESINGINMDDSYVTEEDYIRISNMVRKRKMNSLCYSESNDIPHNSQPNPIQYENKEEKRNRRRRNRRNNDNHNEDDNDDNSFTIRSEGCRNASYKPCSYSLCAMPVDYIDMFKYLFHSEYNLVSNPGEESRNIEKEEVDKSGDVEYPITEESE